MRSATVNDENRAPESDPGENNGKPEDWDGKKLTYWYHSWGVYGDKWPPPEAVEAYCENPPDREGLVDPEDLRDAVQRREREEQSLPDATDNAYRAERQLGDAGMLRDASDPADPWNEPDRVIDASQWNRRKPESVVPGGELQEVEDTVKIVVAWRRAALQPKSDLDHRDRLIICVLAEFMKPCGSSCFPGIKKLMARAAMARNTVRSRLRSLREEGWLNWLECRRASGAHSSRLYVPGVPEDPGLLTRGDGS